MISLTEHQQSILSESLSILSSSNNLIIKGSAGVGKTTLLIHIINKFIDLYPTNKILVTAPTNKAVSVLESYNISSSNNKIKFCTTQSALNITPTIDEYNGKLIFQMLSIKDYSDISLIAVDESSMLSNYMLSCINEIISIYPHLKFIYLGDDKQLGPVEDNINISSSYYSPIFDVDFPTVTLTEIIRQHKDNPIINLSNNLLSFTHNTLRNESFNSLNHGYTIVNKWSSNIKRNIDNILSVIAVNPEDHIYLAYTNERVDFINSIIRKKIYKDEPLYQKFYVGEKIIFNSFCYDVSFRFNKRKTTGYLIVNKSFLLGINNQQIKIKSLEIINSDFFIPAKVSGKRGVSFMKFNYKHYLINNKIKVIHEDDLDRFNSEISILQKGILTGHITAKNFMLFKSQFADVKHCYALTIHKSQGSTYKNVILDYNDISNHCKIRLQQNKLLYTAITRAKNILYIIT